MAEDVDTPSASVSVALATYNGSRYLPEFLQSLTAQTVRPTQLVVLDDTSQDDSVAIVERFARDAPFPVALHIQPQRRGYRDTFLDAAMLCTSEFVSFADQDDVWHPRKLEACLSAAVRHGALLCAHAADKVDADLNPFQRLGQGIDRDGVAEPLTLPPWGLFFGFTEVFRRDLLDLVDVRDRPRDNIEEQYLLAHDRWVYVLGTSLGRTALISEPLALYRQHETNASGHLAQNTLYDRIRAITATSLRSHVVHIEVAEHIARLMSRIAAGSSPYAEAAGRAAEHWSRVGYLQTIRHDIYGGERWFDRARMFARMVGENGYGAARVSGIGGKAMLKDCALGVFRSGALVDGVFRLWPGLGRTR